MKGINQVVDGIGGILLGNFRQMSIFCGRRGAAVAKQALDMTQTQTLLKQMRCVRVPQRMDGYFFLMPHCTTTAFIAACVPPRSMWVFALRMRSAEPTALGNNKRGC